MGEFADRLRAAPAPKEPRSFADRLRAIPAEKPPAGSRVAPGYVEPKYQDALMAPPGILGPSVNRFRATFPVVRSVAPPAPEVVSEMAERDPEVAYLADQRAKQASSGSATRALDKTGPGEGGMKWTRPKEWDEYLTRNNLPAGSPVPEFIRRQYPSAPKVEVDSRLVSPSEASRIEAEGKRFSAAEGVQAASHLGFAAQAPLAMGAMAAAQAIPGADKVMRLPGDAGGAIARAAGYEEGSGGEALGRVAGSMAPAFLSLPFARSAGRSAASGLVEPLVSAGSGPISAIPGAIRGAGGIGPAIRQSPGVMSHILGTASALPQGAVVEDLANLARTQGADEGTAALVGEAGGLVPFFPAMIAEGALRRQGVNEGLRAQELGALRSHEAPIPGADAIRSTQEADAAAEGASRKEKALGIADFLGKRAETLAEGEAASADLDAMNRRLPGTTDPLLRSMEAADQVAPPKPVPDEVGEAAAAVAKDRKVIDENRRYLYDEVGRLREPEQRADAARVAEQAERDRLYEETGDRWDALSPEERLAVGEGLPEYVSRRMLKGDFERLSTEQQEAIADHFRGGDAEVVPASPEAVVESPAEVAPVREPRRSKAPAPEAPAVDYRNMSAEDLESRIQSDPLAEAEYNRRASEESAAPDDAGDWSEADYDLYALDDQHRDSMVTAWTKAAEYADADANAAAKRSLLMDLDPLAREYYAEERGGEMPTPEQDKRWRRIEPILDRLIVIDEALGSTHPSRDAHMRALVDEAKAAGDATGAPEGSVLRAESEVRERDRDRAAFDRSMESPEAAKPPAAAEAPSELPGATSPEGRPPASDLSSAETTPDAAPPVVEQPRAAAPRAEETSQQRVWKPTGTKIYENSREAFWDIGGEVYRAPKDAEMDTLGHPMGKRWESSVAHFLKNKALFDDPMPPSPKVDAPIPEPVADTETPAPVKRRAKYVAPVSERTPVKVKKPGDPVKVIKSMVGKGKKYSDIESHFIVKDGRAYSTDLTTTLEFPSDLPDGTYRFVGNEAVKGNVDAGDFPVVENMTEKKAILTAPRDELIRNLDRAEKFAAKEKMRYSLNGVLVQTGPDGTVRVVATDGTRMSTSGLRDATGSKGENIIVPRETIKYLSALGGDSVSLHKVKGTDHYAFVGDNGQVTFRPVEGTYPNFDEVIPKSVSKQYRVNRDEIVSALKQIEPYAKIDSEKSTVEVTFTDEGVRLYAKNADGHEKVIVVKAEPVTDVPASSDTTGQVVMPVVIEGGKLGLNARYLREASESVNGDSLYLGLNDPVVRNGAKSFGPVRIHGDPIAMSEAKPAKKGRGKKNPESGQVLNPLAEIDWKSPKVQTALRSALGGVTGNLIARGLERDDDSLEAISARRTMLTLLGIGTFGGAYLGTRAWQANVAPKLKGIMARSKYSPEMKATRQGWDDAHTADEIRAHEMVRNDKVAKQHLDEEGLKAYNAYRGAEYNAEGPFLDTISRLAETNPDAAEAVLEAAEAWRAESSTLGRTQVEEGRLNPEALNEYPGGFLKRVTATKPDEKKGIFRSLRYKPLKPSLKSFQKRSDSYSVTVGVPEDVVLKIMQDAGIESPKGKPHHYLAQKGADTLIQWPNDDAGLEAAFEFETAWQKYRREQARIHLTPGMIKNQGDQSMVVQVGEGKQGGTSHLATRNQKDPLTLDLHDVPRKFIPEIAKGADIETPEVKGVSNLKAKFKTEADMVAFTDALEQLAVERATFDVTPEAKRYFANRLKGSYITHGEGSRGGGGIEIGEPITDMSRFEHDPEVLTYITHKEATKRIREARQYRSIAEGGDAQGPWSVPPPEGVNPGQKFEAYGNEYIVWPKDPTKGRLSGEGVRADVNTMLNESAKMQGAQDAFFDRFFSRFKEAKLGSLRWAALNMAGAQYSHALTGTGPWDPRNVPYYWSVLKDFYKATRKKSVLPIKEHVLNVGAELGDFKPSDDPHVMEKIEAYMAALPTDEAIERASKQRKADITYDVLSQGSASGRSPLRGAAIAGASGAAVGAAYGIADDEPASEVLKRALMGAGWGAGANLSWRGLLHIGRPMDAFNRAVAYKILTERKGMTPAEAKAEIKAKFQDYKNLDPVIQEASGRSEKVISAIVNPFLPFTGELVRNTANGLADNPIRTVIALNALGIAGAGTAYLTGAFDNNEEARAALANFKNSIFVKGSDGKSKAIDFGAAAPQEELLNEAIEFGRDPSNTRNTGRLISRVVGGSPVMSGGVDPMRALMDPEAKDLRTQLPMNEPGVSPARNAAQMVLGTFATGLAPETGTTTRWMKREFTEKTKAGTRNPKPTDPAKAVLQAATGTKVKDVDFGEIAEGIARDRDFDVKDADKWLKKAESQQRIAENPQLMEGVRSRHRRMLEKAQSRYEERMERLMPKGGAVGEPAEPRATGSFADRLRALKPAGAPR